MQRISKIKLKKSNSKSNFAKHDFNSYRNISILAIIYTD